MSLDIKSSGSWLLDWSLTIGGIICLVVGTLVLMKSRQPLVFRSFILLVSFCLWPAGVGNLLEASRPALSTRLKWLAKLSIGLALFSMSWTLAHS